MSDDEYDLEAFNDGRHAGYMEGRRDAEREAVKVVASLVIASGGRIEVPDRCMTVSDEARLVRWDDFSRCSTIFAAAAPVVTSTEAGNE